MHCAPPPPLLQIASELREFISNGGVVLIAASTLTTLGVGTNAVCAAPIALLDALLGDHGCRCYSVEG
eukprot:366089-Chlamydomonas_euryale.AAC.9